MARSRGPEHTRAGARATLTCRAPVNAGSLARATTVIAVLLSHDPRGTYAQAVVPSAQFGAPSFPVYDPGREVGVILDRFTELTGNREPRVRHYALHQTLGLNSLYASSSVGLPVSGATARLAAELTTTTNQPTEFLQNGLIHKVFHSPHVPVGYAPSELNGEVSGEIDEWFGPRLSATGRRAIGRMPFFVGGGAALGTIDEEVYVQAGLRIQEWSAWGIDLPTPSIMVRAGAVRGAHAFPDRAITPGYLNAEWSIRVPLDRLLHMGSGVPSIEGSVTNTSGFFRGDDGKKIPEKLCALVFEWARGAVALETWNDNCGNKDQGPTFGLGLRLRGR